MVMPRSGAMVMEEKRIKSSPILMRSRVITVKRRRREYRGILVPLLTVFLDVSCGRDQTDNVDRGFVCDIVGLMMNSLSTSNDLDGEYNVNMCYDVITM